MRNFTYTFYTHDRSTSTPCPLASTNGSQVVTHNIWIFCVRTNLCSPTSLATSARSDGDKCARLQTGCNAHSSRGVRDYDGPPRGTARIACDDFFFGNFFPLAIAGVATCSGKQDHIGAMI